MNHACGRPVPALALLAAFALSAGGCLGVPDVDGTADPLVVRESAAGAAPAESPERAAAVTEMRVRAESAEDLPFPDAFQSAQRARLAARAEPRPVAGVQDIEAELAAIARRRAGGVPPGQLAAMEAREAELRRLAAAAQAASLRR